MKTLQFVAGSVTTTFNHPNEFVLKLPRNGFRSDNDECALTSMTLQYSWPNISAALGNNAFSYSLNGTHPVVMGDGIWQFSDIRAYFQQVMTQNNHYLLDKTGLQVFYIDFVVNPVLYCLSVTIKPVPSTLPDGWTNPGILLGALPQLNIPAGFSSLSGFAAGSYPAAPTNSLYQINSGIPQITHVTSLRVLSDMVAHSDLSLESGVLATFTVPSGKESGSPIQVEPSNPLWVRIQRATTINEISIRIVDQLRRPVTIRDPAGFVLTINIRPII